MSEASEWKIYKTQRKTYTIELPDSYTAVSDYIFNFAASSGKSGNPVIDLEWQGANGATGTNTYLKFVPSDTADIAEKRYSLAQLIMRDSNSDIHVLWPKSNKEGHFYVLPCPKDFS